MGFLESVFSLMGSVLEFTLSGPGLNNSLPGQNSLFTSVECLMMGHASEIHVRTYSVWVCLICMPSSDLW